MSDETTSKSGKTWVYVVGLLVILPVCYALSIGPAYVLAVRGLAGPIGPISFKSVYDPLLWLMNKTDLDEPAEAYIGAWMSLTGTSIR